ncbi:AfsR/SARP family transcriptional regulator [Pseudonocardia cypriaca]|uniref:DNA-binding SARP family transcriptional activator n=1 Tax=Pseudonocardia cypriaca TaxID=882449 RepID=A0A543FSQ4_9PSEU|nr:BTAD domain-containing putative transcriptional regulator [Pseudonocardia cypriaca]TQM36865.1 DNA-binding SARP family transcriptional activator [Pseudonocardia cypriaca]
MEFRILGPVEVRGPRGQARLGGRRPVMLLATLALEGDRTVSHDRLIASVWEDEPPSAVAAALHTYVSRLRRAFADVEPSDTPRILTRPGGYQLVVHPGELDLDLFREQVTSARAAAAAGRAGDAASALASALARWRGPALNGLPGRLAQQAAVLDEEQVTAFEQYIALRMELGADAELVPELRAAIASHPLRERLREQLVLALFRCGRQAEALAAYQEVRRLLDDELGVRPGPALQELHRRVLSGDAVIARQPAPTAGPPVPRQLPSDVAHFTGRAGPLAELDALLLRPPQSTGAVPVAVVEGVGGVGKTALALHWAHRTAQRWPDGQLYVDLRGSARTAAVEPGEALARFLRGLGVPQDQIPVDPEEQAASYRSLVSGKRVLILLDNAGNAEQVRPLLPGSPTCAVLVTTRWDTGGLTATHGASRIILDVLPDQDAETLLARTIGPDRAAAEPDAVAQLVRLCGHLPLALRIAAAQLRGDRGRPVAAHVAELAGSDRLDRLGFDDDQYGDVRASFDLSYRALRPAAARLFRLLGLAPGPDTEPRAAAALGGVPLGQATLLLGELTAAHLVERPTPGRAQLHDLLRLYAADRARCEDSEAERDGALRRLHTFYLDSADAAARLLYPEVASLPDAPREPEVEPLCPSDRGDAVGWLDTERTNLVATVRHTAEHGPHPFAWHLAHALRSCFYFRMNGGDWLETARLGLQAADAAHDPGGRMVMLLSHADAHFCLGAYERALDLASRALPLSRRLGDRRVEAEIMKWSGLAGWLLGRLHEAVANLSRAVAAYREVAEPFGETSAHIGLGIVYDDLARWDDALHHDRCALDLAERTGNRYGKALALHCTGMVYASLGHWSEALGLHAEVLARYRELGTRYHEASALYSAAVVHRDAGRCAAARTDAEQSLATARETGDRRTEANALNTLATVDALEGRFSDAVDGHERARELAARTGFRRAEVEALTGLAVASGGLGDLEGALAAGTAALEGARGSGFRMWEANALSALADAHTACGQLLQAVDHAERALDLHHEIGYLLGEARALESLGRALQARDGTESATPHQRRARAILAGLRAPGRQGDSVRHP